MAVPPKSVRQAARRGLQTRKERAKTTKRPGGTAVGIARARDLSSGRSVSPTTLKRMVSFFSRHDGAVERAARKKNPKGPAAVAWDLWGGTAGRRWATAQLRQQQAKLHKKKR